MPCGTKRTMVAGPTGKASAGIIDDAPTAVSWGPNRIDCFVRGMNNHMYHKWWS